MIINMVGGGGGFSSSNAILGVTALADSVVTINNGTTTKTVTADKSHLLSTTNTLAIYYFGIPSSMFSSSVAWNISAVNHGTTTTATVIINSNAFYDIVLNYRIPYDYQEVTYLESNGNQYIDTMIKTDNVGILNIKFMNLPNETTTVPRYIFGGFNSTKATNSSDGGFGINSVPNSSFGLIFSCDENTHFTSVGSSTVCNFKLSLIGSNKYFTANNNRTDLYSGINIAFNGNLYLFTMHFTDGVSLTNLNKNRIYSCDISNYQNQTVANLIPCYRKNDNVAGMYDNVNHRFLTNGGSGSFTIGSPVN